MHNLAKIAAYPRSTLLCHKILTQQLVVAKSFGHIWPLNLVRNAVFVHFWPTYFHPKILVKNTLFVHFWPRLFWPFGQKCSGQKSTQVIHQLQCTFMLSWVMILTVFENQMWTSTFAWPPSPNVRFCLTPFPHSCWRLLWMTPYV